MNWVDYREKLGIGFSDSSKAKMLSNKVATFISNGKLNENYSDDDYYRFCMMTGIRYSQPYPATCYLERLFVKNNLSIPQIISYYVAFVNTQIFCEESHRKDLFDVLGAFLDDMNIPFEILQDDDGCFVFPKGAKELDDALVSEPLEWLQDYSGTHKAFVKALKSYSEITEENASDVADLFRKALETFFQEFFGKTQSLENLKPEYGKYMKAQGIPSEISNNFETLHQSYTNFMNRYAKHHDKTSKNVLEYIMYQTGNIMRLLITLKAEETNDAN